jgi:hypothetical protein
MIIDPELARSGEAKTLGLDSIHFPAHPRDGSSMRSSQR